MSLETMTDSKYFTTTKKGEIFELRADLNSDRKDKKKDAVKKVLLAYNGREPHRCDKIHFFNEMRINSNQKFPNCFQNSENFELIL